MPLMESLIVVAARRKSKVGRTEVLYVEIAAISSHLILGSNDGKDFLDGGLNCATTLQVVLGLRRPVSCHRCGLHDAADGPRPIMSDGVDKMSGTLERGRYRCCVDRRGLEMVIPRHNLYAWTYSCVDSHRAG